MDRNERIRGTIEVAEISTKVQKRRLKVIRVCNMPQEGWKIRGESVTRMDDHKERKIEAEVDGQCTCGPWVRTVLSVEERQNRVC